MAMPSEIRGRLNPEVDGEAFYLTLGANLKLRLYPEKVFEKLSARIDQGLVAEDAVQEFEQLLFPLARRLDFDSAGRIRIPDKMLERAGLGRKVVLIGVRDHLQLRDRDDWEREVESRLEKQSEIFDRFAAFARRRSGDDDAADSAKDG